LSLQVCLQGDLDKDITVTYWLNILQRLPTSTNVFVTLNPPPELVPRMWLARRVLLVCYVLHHREERAQYAHGSRCPMVMRHFAGDGTVLKRLTLAHPVLNFDCITAQRQLKELQVCK
jgi:predicted NAD/FAD-binding protein